MMYNPTEIAERIAECNNFSDLLAYLTTIEGIQGSHRFYSNTNLVEFCAVLYEGVMPSIVTRSCGLRKKAMQLSGKYSDKMIEFFCKED